jgi:hypothetical protein
LGLIKIQEEEKSSSWGRRREVMKSKIDPF